MLKLLQHFRLEKIVTNKSEEQGLNENLKKIKIVYNLFKKNSLYSAEITMDLIVSLFVCL